MASDGAPLRFFNPGLYQSDEDVISQFCVRETELKSILDVLRGNVESPSCRHVLIAAPGGMGKSMLLARIAAELRRNSEFSGRMLPAVARLSADDEESSLQSEAFGLLRQTADRVGKRLVLLVEDLDKTRLGAGEEFSRQLGEVLLSEPRVMLVATATGSLDLSGDDRQAFAPAPSFRAQRSEVAESRPEARHHGTPILRMFTLQKLKPLTTEECRSLWRSIDEAGAGRNVRPLEILTEGNPRLLAMLAAASRAERRPLFEEIIALADARTEYFLNRFDTLPNSQQRVLEAILVLWRASTTGEIAARARMDVRAVSTMLKRLIERGVVAAETPVGGGRRRYAAAEPLHCIWRKLRRGGAAAEEPVRLLRFMEEFYGSGEEGEMRLSSEAWETGLAFLEVDRAPREVLAVAGDIRNR